MTAFWHFACEAWYHAIASNFILYHIILVWSWHPCVFICFSSTSSEVEDWHKTHSGIPEDGWKSKSSNRTIAFCDQFDKAVDESSLWETTCQSQTFQEQGGFESKLLACEARFRKIERLTARLDLPDTAVTAVVVDLLREPWLWNWWL